MLSEAYVGLGSNLGDRRANIAGALDAIRGLGADLTVSSLYETVPEGHRAQPSFINAVCRIRTRLDPFQLLASLQRAQRGHSRDKAFVNGPRALDLDILLYGRTVLDAPGLTIPHPRMVEREFVLDPLAELAPGLRHPVLRRTFHRLLHDHPNRGRVRQLFTPNPGPSTLRAPSAPSAACWESCRE